MSVSFSATLPLAWSPHPPASGIDSGLLLSVLAILDVLPSADERQADSPRLAAMEAKLDLCLALLAQAAHRQGQTLQATAVSLSGQSAEWQQAEAPVSGAGWLSVVLSPQLPLPLDLPGQLQCQPLAQSGGAAGWRCQVRFAALAEPVQEWLDKTVFRYHRRAISASRTAP